LSATPSKETVPLLLEYDGSSAQRFIKDPDFDNEVTVRTSDGKLSAAETAFMLSVLLLTRTSTVKVLPTLVVIEDGVREILAANIV
jgi:hypothetical protein